MSDFIGSSIAFVVFAGKSGAGGHHYSVRDIGAVLSQKYDVHYIMLSYHEEMKSDGLKDVEKVFRFRIRLNSLRSVKELRKHLEFNNYSAIFILDELAVRIMFVVRPSNFWKLIPIKPGWLSSDAWIGCLPNMICFTNENYLYYRDKPKYKDVNVKLIPNRLKSININLDLINSFKSHINLPKDAIIIMAGARVDLGDGVEPGKKMIFEQSYSMFTELSKRNKNIYLVFVGKPKNQLALDWINSFAVKNSRVRVVTDPYYTTKLAQFFSICSLAVATGRTAMEALSLSKLLLIPSIDSNCLKMVFKDNFIKAMDSNFTQRSVLGDDCEWEKHEDYILGLLEDKEKYDKHMNEINKLCEDKIYAETALMEYEKLINGIDYKKFTLKYFIPWLISIVRIYLVTLRRYVYK